MELHVRQVRADEWESIRALRLRALQDPNAALAFLSTYDQDAARPESVWRSRAIASSEQGPFAQFVADDPSGAWWGSASVIVLSAGTPDERGVYRLADEATVVGVYVDPAARGQGTIDKLLAACAAWASRKGFARLLLSTHEQNARAVRAYERAGFVSTGVRFVSEVGPERQFALELEG